MVLKKGLKSIRSAAMLNDSSIYHFVNIYSCNLQNLIRRCYSSKIPFVCSPHDKF